MIIQDVRDRVLPRPSQLLASVECADEKVFQFCLAFIQRPQITAVRVEFGFDGAEALLDITEALLEGPDISRKLALVCAQRIYRGQYRSVVHPFGLQRGNPRLQLLQCGGHIGNGIRTAWPAAARGPADRSVEGIALSEIVKGAGSPGTAVTAGAT